MTRMHDDNIHDDKKQQWTWAKKQSLKKKEIKA